MIVFLQNVLGFFIQFYPCALVIFLPFPQEDYRFRRRQIFTWMMAISAAAAVMFSAILCLRDMSRYPKHVLISNTFMLAAILFVLTAYIWLVRELLLKKVLVFFIVLFYAVTEFVMVNVIHTFLFPNIPDTTAYPYTVSYLLLYVLVTALLLPLMLAVVIRPLREYIQKIEPGNMKREFYVVICSTLAYFFLMIYCDTSFGKEGLFHLYLPLMLFLTVNQILIYWLIFQESVRRKQDSERQRAMEIQQFQYERIAGDMENTRRLRHDLRHHYNSLNDMLDRGQLDEMRDYLSTVINTTIRRDNEVYCNNMTVNGLLQYYIGLARDEGILCEALAECGEMTIDATDLTVLFGNAMENAIQACRKCPENRWIKIQIGTVQGSLAIEISNSCRGVRISRRFQTNDGFLPAEAFPGERTENEYGLRSIAHTAQKYDGSAGFRYNAQKETFTARIRLNMYTDV